jgi:hypothetical protein
MAGAGAFVRPQWYGRDTCGTVLGGVDGPDNMRIRAAAKGLEQELKHQRYLNPDVVPDGVIRDTTHNAIKRFQRDHGLKPDGAIGPITSRALFRPVVLWEQEAGDIKIPGGYLHGQMALESNYDPGAEGVATLFGIDRGIVQLNSESYPELSPKQIYSTPRMCIAIGAARLRSSRRRESDELGYAEQDKWDCAILDHNWPVAADYLYDTGEWLLTTEEQEAGIAPEQGRAFKYVNRVKTRGAMF